MGAVVLGRGQRTTSVSMVEVDPSSYAAFPGMVRWPVRVWQSRDYLAVLYVDTRDGSRCLSVNRTATNRDGSWMDGITWDELQRVKNETVGPETWAVEVFPAQSEMINEANMRHLWVLDEAPSYAWKGGKR